MKLIWNATSYYNPALIQDNPAFIQDNPALIQDNPDQKTQDYPDPCQNSPYNMAMEYQSLVIFHHTILVAELCKQLIWAIRLWNNIGSFKAVFGYFPFTGLTVHSHQYISDPGSFYLDIVVQPVLSVRQSCKMTNNATPPPIYHVPCHGLATCFNAFLANPLQSMQDCINGSSMCLDSAAIQTYQLQYVHNTLLQLYRLYVDAFLQSGYF